MIASSRISLTCSGVISGSGLAIAKMMGLSAMPATISGVIESATESPKNTSAPLSASARECASVSTAWADFHWFIPCSRPLVDDAPGVAEDGLIVGQSQSLDQLGTRHAPGAGAVDHDPGVLDLPSGELEGVDQAGDGDDRGAVLVVVEDRDVHQLAQPLLDDEALGRLDVLEVDAAERRTEIAHAVDEFIDVAGIDLDVDPVDVGEALEEDGLALHHGLGRERPEIAEPQHRRAVADHGDDVGPGRVVVGVVGVLRDLDAGHGHPRRVGERQIPLGGQRLRRRDLDLSGLPGRMKPQRLFFRHADRVTHVHTVLARWTASRAGSRGSAGPGGPAAGRGKH